MERFVFVAAVTIAIIIGVFAAFGGHWGRHFSFNIDGVEAHGMAPVVALQPGHLQPQTFAGNDLRLRYLAANVTITPEDRSDFSIEIDNGAGRAPTPTVTVEHGRVIVDGQLRGRIGGCDNGGASLRGYDDITADQMPRIIIHAPRDLTVERDGAGTTEIAASQALNLDVSGCGPVTIGDVTEDLSLDLAGSGDVQAGAAHKLDADIAGSGNVTVGAVAEGAELDMAGAGSVEMASLHGDLTTNGAGAGNLRIHGGAIDEANIDLAGAGDVDIAAPVQTLKVSIVGAGNVDVTAAVHDVEADIAGVGSVHVQSLTGSLHKEVFGPGDVRVGQ